MTFTMLSGEIHDLRNAHVLTLRRAGSQEPVGGIARFIYLTNQYARDPKYNGLPGLITLFSGDAYNPSLESSVTKGRHMVPFLNMAGTQVAAVGVCTTAPSQLALKGAKTRFRIMILISGLNNSDT